MLPMSLCARAVALSLAACALAARAQAERVRPQCTTDDYSRCEYTAFGEFAVNGNYLKIDYDSDTFSAWCNHTALDDPSWPSFPYPVYYQTVRLRYCALDPKALRRLNINYRRLILEDVSGDMTAAAFAELPADLEFLSLSVRADRWAVLEPGVLDPFLELRRLELRRVRLDPLPRNLEEVLFWDTDMAVLPLGTNRLSSLEIVDSNLKTIKLTDHRLNKLVLHSGVLTTLVLHDATPTLLKNGLLDHCPALKVLELQRSSAKVLPRHLLRGADELIHFTYIDGFIHELPKNFFKYTTRLQVIDLSENILHSLSSEVFSHLTDLRVLWLDNNLLNALDLLAVQPLTNLITLSLNGNPLGDLCPTGNTSVLSPLTHLQELSLVATGTRFCPAWLQEMPELRYLDLPGNDLDNITCADLRVLRAISNTSTVIDLRYNPLGLQNCSIDDEDDDVEIKQIQVMVDIHEPPNCLCNCSFVQCITPPSSPPSNFNSGTTGGWTTLALTLLCASSHLLLTKDYYEHRVETDTDQ